MNRDKDRAIYNLLWVWFQYGYDNQFKWDKNKQVMAGSTLNHACMNAGENAADFLIENGLGTFDGWSFMLNEKGAALMNDDSLDTP